MNCKKCGSPLEPGVQFCPKCGETVDGIVSNQQMVQQQPVQQPVQPVMQQSVQQPMPQQPIVEEKKNSKLLLIIVICAVVLVVAIVIGVVVIKGNSKSDNKESETKSELKNKESEKEEEKKDKYSDEESYSYDLFDSSKIKVEYGDKEDLAKNIEILGYYRNDLKKPGKYEKVAIYGKNNNSEPVDLRLALQFFDKNGTRIDEKISHGNNLVKANSEFVLEIDIKDDSDPYDTMKLICTANKTRSYQTDVPISPDDIKTEILTNGNVDVTIKNNSDKEVTFGNAGYVFYKDGKVVFAAEGYYDNPIPVGGVSKSTFYGSALTNGEYGDALKKIEFDEVRFLLFSAYFSDESNY